MSKLLWCLGLAMFAFPAAGAPKWEKVVAPQFTIYSSGKSADTLRTAEELTQFIAALSRVLPVDTRALPPLTVVLFGRDREFRDFRPKRPDGKPWNVAGFFSRREGWAVFGLATADLDDEVRRTVFHEAVHWFSSAYNLPNPPWLEEGLAEVFSTFAVNKGTASWGEAIDYHVAVLQSTTQLPVARLLSVSHGDVLFNENRRVGEFYAGSWVFVHYLLFGKHEMPRSVLSDYLGIYRTGIHPDEAFKRAFGRDQAEMDRQLRRYLDGGRYYTGKVLVQAIGTPLKVEPASDVEREVALARLALGAGHADRALTLAKSARVLGPESAAASEVLGYAAEAADDEATALAAYTEAAAQGSKDHRVYFALGAHAHRAGVSSEHGSMGNLDEKEARRIANYYERAINLRPTFLPAYQNLGGIIELAGKAGDTDRQFLAFGQEIFPNDGMIRLGLAVLDRKLGAREKSRQWLDSVLNAEQRQPPTVAAYAQRLDEAWNYQDRTTVIQAFAAEKKFGAAIGEIDRALAGRVSPAWRNELVVNRRILKTQEAYELAREAADSRKWSEVRRLLDEILASDAPASAKQSARQWRADIDRRNLR